MAPGPYGMAVDGAKNRMSGPVKVLFSCTGVGHFNRGIESFFREAFDGLKNSQGLEAKLIKGGGAPEKDEWVVNILPRTGRFAEGIGKIASRNGYVVEQWSSFPSIAIKIRQWRPQVIFYSDSNLGFLLHRFRQAIGVPYRLLFSNGGPCAPPFGRTDYVHQVAPQYLDEAISFGEPAAKHFLVPYGIGAGDAPQYDIERKNRLKRQLQLPLDRPVILSVGWISRHHKRMDYVIEEVSRLPPPVPYLQLLGAMDQSSNEIIALGNRLLGADGFGVASVPYEKVSSYYNAADIFVLASLNEGFGRVYLEALLHGLPVIAHDFAVAKFVLGGEGYLADLSQSGGLANAIHAGLSQKNDAISAMRRWKSVRDRFSWQVLAAQYLGMFRHAAAGAGASELTGRGGDVRPGI